MGCSCSRTSVRISPQTNPTFDNDTNIEVTVWAKRMCRFIKAHMQQTMNYSEAEVEIMYDKFQRFMRSAGSHNRTLADPIHKNAMDELQRVFMTGETHKTLENHLCELAITYGYTKRTIEFEEIALVFSIIVNAPMIRFYETKW
jgi:hypothetical protein